MGSTSIKLLRRTLAALGAGLLLAASLPAASQGTVTLSNATGNSCSYSSMTVQPNGTILVTCNASTTVPTDPKIATFAVTGTASSGAPGSTGSVSISRTGGTGVGDITIQLTISANPAGACDIGTVPLVFAEGGPAVTWPYQLHDSGTCTISISVPSPHGGNPTAWPVTIQTTTTGGGGGTPGPVAGCEAYPPATNSIARALDYGPVDQLRMKSGVIAYYPVIPEPDSRYASVEFSQGQQPNTPGSVTTEFSVSKCPGVIRTDVPDCYYKAGTVNNNKITIYTRTKPEWGWNDQASMAGYGCLADASQGKYYVNVKWTYPTCVWGDNNCGFSMQWSLGAW